MNYWTHKGKSLKSMADFPTNCIGFVYKITNVKTGRFYIGKKILHNTNTIKISKRALKEITGLGRRPTKTKVVKESNWQSYYGSCKPLLEDINLIGKNSFEREVLHFCYSKKSLSYFEFKYQIVYEVLERPTTTYNGNILGKFFSADLMV